MTLIETKSIEKFSIISWKPVNNGWANLTFRVNLIKKHKPLVTYYNFIVSFCCGL